MREILPIKIRVKCIDNAGIENRFEEGVEYAWLGIVGKTDENKNQTYWRVEDATGNELTCLPERFAIVDESRRTGVKVKLVGEDGNIFFIMARVCEAMKLAGIHKDVRTIYQQQVMSAGSYSEALYVTTSYVEDMTYEEKLKKLQEECGITN